MQRFSNGVINLSQQDVMELASDLYQKVKSALPAYMACPLIYGVPRGGIPVLFALLTKSGLLGIAETPEQADVIVDDIIDSGKTRDRFKELFPEKPFLALVNKEEDPERWNNWVVFPWEKTAEGGIEDNIRRVLQYVGEDPSRQGLLETPKRVAKAWAEWTSGYSRKPEDVLKCFEDGADSYDQIIIVKDIPFYSHCEHHMAPFFGTCHVGYIPNGQIVGLSKIPDLVNVFAQRLQVQERLTSQIVEALWSGLAPKGAGIVMEARHMCMESRGKKVHGQSTKTSAFRGVMLNDPSCKAEFLSLIN